MKSHYDFSKGERGKFYDPDAVFIKPQEADLLQEIAQSLSQIEWGRYHGLILASQYSGVGARYIVPLRLALPR